MRKHFFMPSTSFPASTVTLGNNETWARAGMFGFPCCTSYFIQRSSLLRQEIDPEDPEFGDQGFYFAIWTRYGRRMFRDLSISWDMTHCRYSWVPPSVLCGTHRSRCPCSYGLSLADGDDGMDETEQISKQIFMREGKVYDRWYQLYPALLHLCVTAYVTFMTARGCLSFRSQ